MSKFLHDAEDDDTKARAIPRVSENRRTKSAHVRTKL